MPETLGPSSSSRRPEPCRAERSLRPDWRAVALLPLLLALPACANWQPSDSCGSACAPEAGGAETPNLIEAPNGVTYELPPGYTLSEADWAVDVEELGDGAECVRTAVETRWMVSERPEALVRLAQSIYPPAGKGSPRFQGPGHWWESTSEELAGDLMADCPRLATRAAAAHSAACLADEADRWEAESPCDERFGALHYETEVALREELWLGDERYQRVYVISVELYAGWSCGPVCGYFTGPSPRRTVLVTEGGRVLGVIDSDGATCRQS